MICKCGQQAKNNRKRCQTCINKDKARSKFAFDRWRMQNRYAAIFVYSNGEIKCKCCGESNIRFLTIDHIEGRGNVHRKDILNTPSGTEFYSWIVKNKFPPGYQVLCWNCNCAKKQYKICPHNYKEISKDEIIQIIKESPRLIHIISTPN